VSSGNGVSAPAPAIGTVDSPLLSLRGLVKHFPLTSGWFGRSKGAIRALDGVSFDVARGETLGVVGE
jgi:ABC-type oligopeptide transport system ATPase subunit